MYASEKMMENESIDWYAVELFLAVCEAGGITAAVRSGVARISQPALSAQMSSLEAMVGCVLFERKPFRLTREGMLFRSEFLQLRRKMQESVERIKQSHEGSLRIAASDVVINRHLPKLLETLAMPESARLYLKDAPSHELPGLVREGEVDLAIGVMPTLSDRGKFPLAEVLMQVPVGIIYPKQARVAPLASWAELKAMLLEKSRPGLISLPKHNLISTHVSQALAKQGISWPITAEVSSLSHVATFVGLGLGYGINLAYALESNDKSYHWLPFPPHVVPPLKIGMWYGDHPPELAKRFIRIAREYTKAIASNRAKE